MGQNSWSYGPPCEDPPEYLRIFAPDGTRKDVLGWLIIGPIKPPNGQQLGLIVIQPGGARERLNPRVVVWQKSTDTVLYTPRDIPDLAGNRTFPPADLQGWLNRNRHWPAVLELEAKAAVNWATWDKYLQGEN